MHLMRWQQLFPQIFRCSYPFPVHLKSIFVAGASWKVAQSKTKLTLFIYVRSEEDDSLGPIPLDIYLLYYLLRGLFPRFLPFGRVIIKEWGSSPTQRLTFSPPHYDSSSVQNLQKFCEAHMHVVSATRVKGANVNGHSCNKFYGSTKMTKLN